MQAKCQACLISDFTGIFVTMQCLCPQQLGRAQVNHAFASMVWLQDAYVPHGKGWDNQNDPLNSDQLAACEYSTASSAKHVLVKPL